MFINNKLIKDYKKQFQNKNEWDICLFNHVQEK
jgi:hypothetical protein